MEDFPVSELEQDEIDGLRKQLLDPSLDRAATTRHIELLRGKLHHIIDRIDCPPSRILAHVRVYVEDRPDLVKSDEQCVKLLIDLLKSCKTLAKKSIVQLNGSSSNIAVFAANALHRIHYEEKSWPLDLLLLYMEDSLGQRQWVDSPETSFFTSNLLFWTTVKDDCCHSTLKATPNDDSPTHLLGEETVDGNLRETYLNQKDATRTGGSTPDDDSSGDEEVLEESTVSMSEVELERAVSVKISAKRDLSSVSDRYVLDRQAAKEIVVDLLTSKSGQTVGNSIGRMQGQGSSSTSAIVACMSSFCGLPEIRQLASCCLDKWLGNPAIVDLVKSLLCRIADCLEVVSIGMSSDSMKFGTYETLSASDMAVVREIVKLRLRLKASQLELYKSTLILIANKGIPVAKLIIRSMIAADLSSGVSAVRGDTVKLLLAILNAGHAQATLRVSEGGSKDCFPTSVSSSSSLSVGHKMVSNVSVMVGEVFGELCHCVLTKNSLEDVLDNNDDNDASKETLSSNHRYWTPAFSRVLLDLLVRLLRGLEGSKCLNFAKVLRGILGSPRVLADAASTHYRSLDKVTEDSWSKQPAGRKSKSHLIEWEMMTFFADVSISLQLLLASEISTLEKSYKDRQLQLVSNSGMLLNPLSGAAPNSNNPVGYGANLAGKDMPSASLPLGNGMAGGNMGTGRGSGRGRGGGRGTALLSAPSSMFRGSAMRASAAVGMVPRTGKLGITAASSSAVQAAVHAASVQDKDCSISMTSSSSEDLDAKFQLDRNDLWSKILSVQETACSWIEELSRASDARILTSSGTSSGVSSMDCSGDLQQHITQPPSAPSCDDGDNESAENVDVHQLWSEWMQKVCCLIQSSLTKIQLDFERNAALLLRDNGFVSSELLRKAADLFTNTATSTAHMSSGLSLLEALVHRGIKSKGPGDTTGILIDDIEIFPLLFELSRMVPVPVGSMPRPALPMPHLAVKSLYWRVSTLCFTLGCARPECLGVYLWTTYPPVKSLMLMAISSRFYSPVEALLDECVGTKETDAALFARTESAGLSFEKLASSCILNYRATNGIDLFITSDSVQVRWGRVHEIEIALSNLERDLTEYLFGVVPVLRPAEPSAPSSSSSGGNSGTRKRMRVAADEDIESIRDEREKQGQRREQERGARAERAAARLQRDASTPHLRTSGLPGAGAKVPPEVRVVSNQASIPPLPLTSRKVAESSADEASILLQEMQGRATEDAAMGLAILSSSLPLSTITAEISGRASAEEYSIPPLKIPALVHSDGPPCNTTRGELGLEELMVLRCEGMPRIPPDSIIKTVKGLSTKFGFGAKLRSCTDPDFIARAITADPTRGDEDLEAMNATVETTDFADTKSDNAARNALPVLRVSRSAVEVSSSWLVPTILEDADAILRRIPNAACLHLLLLSTVKSFARLNTYGLWSGDCSDPSTPEASRLSISDRAEVSRSSILFFDSHEDLSATLLNSAEHASEIKFLCALANKIKLLFPSSSSTETQYREQREFLKILLSDLKSNQSDRRAGARLVLSFLAGPHSPSPEGSAENGSHSYAPLLPLLPVQNKASSDLQCPSNLVEAVRWAFVRGPSLVDFTSFLMGLCNPCDRTSCHPGTHMKAEPSVNALVESQRNCVVDCLVAVAAEETECSVLAQLLGALHALDSQFPSDSKSSTTAANILLNMYATRRLTAEFLLASLVRNRRWTFLASILSRDLERIKEFSTVDTDRGSAAVGSGGIVLTKTGGSGVDQCIRMDISALKMLLFITLETVQCFDNCNHVIGDVDNAMQEDRAVAESTFTECAYIILGTAAAKDCKVHFLPCIAEVLCTESITSRSNPLSFSVHTTAASKGSVCSDDSPAIALRPLIAALSASSLLDLLTVLSAERQVSSPLIHSGLSAGILKMIVEAIDSKLMCVSRSSDSSSSSSSGSSSAGEVWRSLVKPYSAKKVERIQCELQPLVLEIFARAAADPSDSIGSPKYWALHSATLTNLFTLKELHSATQASTALSTGPLSAIRGNEGEAASTEPMDHDLQSNYVATDEMSISHIALPLDRTDVTDKVTEMTHRMRRVAEHLARGNILEALHAISSAINLVTCDDAVDTESTIQGPRGGSEVGVQTRVLGDAGVSREALSWCQGLLQSVIKQSTQHGLAMTTVSCIASALMSRHEEDVLLALALTGIGCDISGRAHVLLDPTDISHVARFDFSSTRWCLCARALVPLLSRDVEQALHVFLRGMAVFTLFASEEGTDGTVLFVLLRQLLSLIAESLHHRSRKELVDSILPRGGPSCEKKPHQDVDRSLEHTILRLLPAVRIFVSLLNDTVSGVGADETDDTEIDQTHWVENGVQGFTFPGGVRDKYDKVTHTRRSLESRGVKCEGIHEDMAAREGLREESEELLRLVVKSDESSYHIWSDLSFYLPC